MGSLLAIICELMLGGSHRYLPLIFKFASVHNFFQYTSERFSYPCLTCGIQVYFVSIIVAVQWCQNLVTISRAWVTIYINQICFSLRELI